MIALVVGCASSGKSAYAERLCCELGGDLVYVATMRPYGEEGASRVRKHRAQRAGKGFATVECYGNLSDLAGEPCLDGATVLLEGLGNAVANDLFGEGAGGGPSPMRGIEDLSRRAAHVVVVSEQVGCDGVAYADETRHYQKELGRLSCQVAAAADLVVECTAGLPSIVKQAALPECVNVLARACR